MKKHSLKEKTVSNNNNAKFERITELRTLIIKWKVILC